jgi:hypothetical protein
MSDDADTIRRLNDIRDVIRAMAAAARLLDDELAAVETDLIDIMQHIRELEQQR